MSLVRLQQESLGYGDTPVLTDLNLELQANERVAILGRSGAGKTTLLTAIYDALLGAGHRVSLVPQELALVPQLSVVKNTLMGRLDDYGALHNILNLLFVAAQNRREISTILNDLGLAHEADRAVEELSGGQKQRTALARAFYRSGDVLIGDEPFSALDETQGKNLLEQSISRFSAVVFAVHNLQQASAFATRIIGLRGGRIEIDAAPEAVSQDQLHALYLP